MPTGLCTRWDCDSETNRFTPRRNRTRSSEEMVMSYFQQTRTDCKIGILYTTEKNWLFQCWWILFALKHGARNNGLPLHLCPCQDIRSSLTEEDIQHGSTKRDFDELRRSDVQKKFHCHWNVRVCNVKTVQEKQKCQKMCPKEVFSYRNSLAADQLLKEVKNGNLFGYVQCDIELPRKLRINFANLFLIFKITLVIKNDNGHSKKMYAEEKRIMSQPRKKMISSFTLQNATLITPLLLFYKHLGLVVTKTHRFVE